MAGHLATVDGPPSDGELISAVRGGDSDAYGELFTRHVESARRLARQLVSAGDVDDLVSEAFAKVLVVLQRGGGPDLAFRAYLLTAVRRLHVDRIRSTGRLRTTDDLTPFDPGVPFRDTAIEGFESAAAARAFASLPERWQLVLWHTEVEGQKPAEVATLLGMTPNSVSALAYRAREGLRQAYLSMHAQDTDDDACARTQAALGAYVRGGLSRRDSTRVEEHLEGCRRCAAIYLELTEVNSRLGGLLAPLLLGAVATAYVGSAAAGGGAVAAGGVGGVGVLLGRVKDAVLAHGPTAAVAGAAASAVAVGLLVTLNRAAPEPPAAEDAPAVVDRTRAPGGPADRADRTDRADGPRPVSARSSGSGPTTAPAGLPGTGSTTPGTPTTPEGPASTQPSQPEPTPPAQPTEPTQPQPTQPQPTQPTGPSEPSGPEPSAPPASPLVELGVEVSVGPDGVGVGVSGGALGVQLPPVEVTVPVGVGTTTP